jgi:hypothetical protein
VIEYTPIALHRGKVKVAMNVDMKLALIPISIIELVCKRFCSDFLQKVMEISTNFKGSEWEKRVKRRPDAFNYFKKVMN